jgi:hypothetical protein
VTRTSLVVVLYAGALAAGCKDHERGPVRREPISSRRVIDPPPSSVRALPPHAIRADGVGPYRLGATLAALVEQQQAAPRISRFEVPGLVHADVLHSEDDTILVGGEPQGRARFVAVLGTEIARTESGIHVGSTRDELARTLGPAIDDPARASDPRLIAPSQLPELRAVLEGDRVVALVVGDAHAAAAPGRAPGDATPGCTRPAGDPGAHRFGMCGSAAGETYTTEGEELVLRTADGEHVTATARIAGLQFAVPLRIADGRDELVAIARSDDAVTRSWTLTALRLDGGKLVRTIDSAPLFQLTTTSARWVGADLRDLDLYLELAERGDAIEVGGYLTSRTGGKLRDLVAISPTPVPHRHAKPAPPEATDAGVAPPPSGPAGEGSEHPGAR